MQNYKLPGGTEPVAKWNLLPDAPVTPDRPEVSTATPVIYHSGCYGLPFA